MKIFAFVKKVFFIGSTILSSFKNAIPLSCISMKNQECKTRAQVININSNNPIFYPFSIKTKKILIIIILILTLIVIILITHMQKFVICVPDVIKDLNVKIFNLMSTTNETRFIKWQGKCNCKCRLDAIICNNKQRWKKNKCRCECRELIDKGICDKGFIWTLVIVNVNVIKIVILVNI